MKIVAVTACPTGIAHTYMAAEQLEKSARAAGHQIKVETQGAMGIENELSAQEIREAEVDNSTPWARKHWRALEWNYRRAPHFKTYADGFRELYDRPWKSFCELTCAFIELILRVLGLSTPMERTSALGITGESTGLVLAMCKATGADTYISGVHGKDYLDVAEFERQGIKLVFQEFQCPVYPQCWPGEFIPNLSIVDLIFNCGPESLKVLTRDRHA